MSFGFIAGVPDSSLAPVSYLWHDPPAISVVCTNEGSAVAMAAGWAIGSGQCPLVYMQNSGLTNALNPLMSMTHRSVHPVPMVLLIGMRGWPGDEPQHGVIGQSTASLLRSADIAFMTAEADSAILIQALGRAHIRAKASGSPVAVLAHRSLSAIDHPRPDGQGRTQEGWTSQEAVQAILEAAHPEAIVVSSTGFNTRYVHQYRTEHPGQYHQFIYCVGAMGHSCSVAQGMAIARPASRVVCIDGDGAALMHLGAVVMPSSLSLRNYVHVVVNNGCHESVGGGNTLGSILCFSDIVDKHRWTTGLVRGPATPSVARTLDLLLNADGPVLVEIFTRPTFAPAPARPTPPFAKVDDIG